MLRIKKKIKIIKVGLKQYRNLKYKQKKKENLKKIIGGNKMKKIEITHEINDLFRPSYKTNFLFIDLATNDAGESFLKIGFNPYSNGSSFFI